MMPPPGRAGDRGGSGEGCSSGGGSFSHGSPRKALEVTLADTDQLAYTVGDIMPFSIALQNTGSAPLILGISRDPEIAPKTMRPCRVVLCSGRSSVSGAVEQTPPRLRLLKRRPTTPKEEPSSKGRLESFCLPSRFSQQALRE